MCTQPSTPEARAWRPQVKWLSSRAQAVVWAMWVIFLSCQQFQILIVYFQVTAQAWSIAGASGIILVGRTASALESTAKSLKVPSFVVVANVVLEKETKSVFDQTLAKFGKVDVLINAAGSMNAGLPSEKSSHLSGSQIS